FVGLGAAIVVGRGVVFAGAVDLPGWARGAGWATIAAATAFGTVADRQIGFRVRSFMPFFYARGKIELRTTGAYAVVRHPISPSGIWFQLGASLAPGAPPVLVACAVSAAGATWFTRREEERLVALLDEPAAYARYRERVPALLPWPRPRPR